MAGQQSRRALAILCAVLMTVLAGAALTGDSSEAESGTVYREGSVNVTAESCHDDLFLLAGTGTAVTVPADVVFTGTVAFGYAAGSGAAAFVILSFAAGASGFSVAYADGAAVLSGSGTVAVALAQGTLVVGTAAVGTSAAIDTAAAQLTVTEAHGLAVTVRDGTVYLAGGTAAGSVAVTGTAYDAGLTATATTGAGGALPIRALAAGSSSFAVAYAGTDALAGAAYTDAGATVDTGTAGQVKISGASDGGYTLTLNFAPLTADGPAATLVLDVAVADGQYWAVPRVSETATTTVAAKLIKDPGYEAYPVTLTFDRTDLSGFALYTGTGLAVAAADYTVSAAAGTVTVCVRAATAVQYGGEFCLAAAAEGTTFLATLKINTSSSVVSGQTYYSDGTASSAARDSVSAVAGGATEGGVHRCGDDLTWSYDLPSGTLSFAGSGRMTDYAADRPAPWAGLAVLNPTVSLPTGLTSLGSYAFAGFRFTELPAIPASVTAVGDWCFADCASLRTAALPEGVAHLGASAFRQCTALTDLTLPASVTAVGESAFRGCRALTALELDSPTAPYLGHDCLNLADGSGTAACTVYSQLGQDFLPASAGTTAVYAGLYEITAAVTPADSATVDGAGLYRDGAKATLTVHPASGYRFVKWNDGNSAAVRTVTVSAAAAYTAICQSSLFSTVSFALGMETEEAPPSMQIVHEGTAFALPDCSTVRTGYAFGGWSDGRQTYAAGAEYTVPAGDTTLTAVWIPRVYTLTVTAGIGGVATGAGSYDYGTTATLTAAPQPGFVFVQWSDGCRDAVRTVTVGGDTEYHAEFAQNYVLLTFFVLIVSTIAAIGVTVHQHRKKKRQAKRR